jgi:hypothetical protein
MPTWNLELYRLGLFLMIFGMIEINTGGGHRYWLGLLGGLLTLVVGPGLVWCGHNRRIGS